MVMTVCRLRTVIVGLALLLVPAHGTQALAAESTTKKPPAASKPAATKAGSKTKSATTPQPAAKPKTDTPTASVSSAPATRALAPAAHGHAAAAFAAAEARRWEQARREAAQAGDPLVRAAIDWLWLQQPGSGADFETVADFMARHPDWPAQQTLQRRAEEALDWRVSDARVLGWLGERKPLTGDGMIRYGTALLNNGRSEEGLNWLRTGWIKGNFASKEEAEIWRDHHTLFSDADNWARLDRLLWERQTAAARRMLPRVESDRRTLAEARLGLIEDAGNVDRLIDRVPADLANDGGLAYERLRWRRQKGRSGAAEDILVEAPDDLGRAEKWWVERHLQARRALAEGRVSEAYRLVAGHGQSDPRYLAEAEWLAGWIALRFLNEPEAAERHFRRLYESVRFPVSQARGAYWTARALKAQGDEDRARSWYRNAAEHPTTFYGQMALIALEQRGPLALPRNPLPSSAQVTAFERRELVRVARLLAELGQDNRLRTFVLRLQELAASPGEHALVADLARRIGRIDLAVAAAKRSAQSGITLVNDAYPLVDPLTRDYGPERALVLAVSRQESEFNAQAISSAGARGLMQLMPATAKQVARALRIDYRHERLTADPAYNARLGSSYLAGLLDSWDGNYVLTLAAYNAGDGRVRSWIRDWGDPRRAEVDPVDWIELIPFSETRNYVQRVLEGVQVYRQLVSPNASQLLRLDEDLRGRAIGRQTCATC
jgi:soluble lytic murein transglycosylase